MGTALLSYGAARSLLGEARRWAGGRGPAALDLWWALWLPFWVGTAALVAICAIWVLRALRARRPAAALVLLAGGLIVWGGLGTGIFSLTRGASHGPRSAGERAWPRRPFDLFSREQWQELADRRLYGERLGPLGRGGVGLAERPFLIPFDGDLLERVTLVGLPARKVGRLLGSPLPDPSVMGPAGHWNARAEFRMCCPEPDAFDRHWVLELTFSRRTGAVITERLVQRHQPLRAPKTVAGSPSAP